MTSVVMYLIDPIDIHQIWFCHEHDFRLAKVAAAKSHGMGLELGMQPSHSHGFHLHVSVNI